MKLDEGDTIAWSAYHFSWQEFSNELTPAIMQLLPLQPIMTALIKHGMEVYMRTTQFL